MQSRKQKRTPRMTTSGRRPGKQYGNSATWVSLMVQMKQGIEIKPETASPEHQVSSNAIFHEVVRAKANSLDAISKNDAPNNAKIELLQCRTRHSARPNPVCHPLDLEP